MAAKIIAYQVLESSLTIQIAKMLDDGWQPYFGPVVLDNAGIFQAFVKTNAGQIIEIDPTTLKPKKKAVK